MEVLELADKMINFRCDIILNNKIEKYVNECFGGGNKSDFLRTAIEEYFKQKKQEFCGLPNEIRDNIAFLYQLIVTVEDLSSEKELLKSEVTRLWQMAQNTQS